MDPVYMNAVIVTPVLQIVVHCVSMKSYKLGSGKATTANKLKLGFYLANLLMCNIVSTVLEETEKETINDEFEKQKYLRLWMEGTKKEKYVYSTSPNEVSSPLGTAVIKPQCDLDACLMQLGNKFLYEVKAGNDTPYAERDKPLDPSFTLQDM